MTVSCCGGLRIGLYGFVRLTPRNPYSYLGVILAGKGTNIQGCRPEKMCQFEAKKSNCVQNV